MCLEELGIFLGQNNANLILWGGIMKSHDGTFDAFV